MSRQDIEAISRVGFLTLDSEPKGKLYLDDKPYSETPFERYPLKPGIYKAKLVANGKTKRFELTIYGGKDTNLGVIDWSTK